jgi:hypothetical protein
MRALERGELPPSRAPIAATNTASCCTTRTCRSTTTAGRAAARFDSLITVVAPDSKPVRLPVCSDRDDQKFLELARDAGAAILVTKDKALLKTQPQDDAGRDVPDHAARGLGQTANGSRARISDRQSFPAHDHPCPAIAPARCRHHRVHHHVGAGQPAWRRQPRPGLPRFRLRPAPARRRQRGHARRPQPVSAHDRRAGAARGDRRQDRQAVRPCLRRRAARSPSPPAPPRR